MTVHRASCGSLPGLLAHQSAGEEPCGFCAQADAVARLAAEALRPCPGPSRVTLPPVTREQAELNADHLLQQLDLFEVANRNASVTRYTGPDELAARRARRRPAA